MPALVAIVGDEIRRYVGRDKKGRLVPSHEAVLQPDGTATLEQMVEVFRRGAIPMEGYVYVPAFAPAPDYWHQWISACRRLQKTASAGR